MMTVEIATFSGDSGPPEKWSLLSRKDRRRTVSEHNKTHGRYTNSFHCIQDTHVRKFFDNYIFFKYIRNTFRGVLHSKKCINTSIGMLPSQKHMCTGINHSKNRG
mmetsp:Transcript_24785/g.49312  ORF Transcript_24785/g.49312 Transcript_24785/m.49312 type:complete len:105 (+) Transcript_24785:176-490(+)